MREGESRDGNNQNRWMKDEIEGETMSDWQLSLIHFVLRERGS